MQLLKRAERKLKRLAFLQWKGARHRTRSFTGCPAKQVGFVSGVQRSGTNMVMFAIEQHPWTDVFHESDSRAYHDFDQRSEAVLQALAKRSAAPRVIFKGLQEADLIPGQLERFAPARALWLYRDWRDVVNSIVARWPDHRNEMDAILSGEAVPSWRGRANKPDTIARLARHYDPSLSNAAINTLYWIMRNELYFDLGLDRDQRSLCLRYESILSDPETAMTRLCSHFSMPENARMLGIPSPAAARTKPAPAIPEEIAALADEMLERLDHTATHDAARRTS